MYPSSVPGNRNARTKVDNELGSFYSGTQFRTFKEITLAAAGVYVVRMIRPVDIIIRGFAMRVGTGEMRCDIYRGATLSGTFNEILPVLGKCEFSDNPLPIYTPKSELAGGGNISGGTLYDLMHVKTAGATGQASTIGDGIDSQLGAPAGSVGAYRFSNPGNSPAVCVFSMWWEELPTK